MRTLFALALCVAFVASLSAQDRVVPSTPFTRDLLRSADAATARTKLGVFATSSNIFAGLPTHIPSQTVGIQQWLLHVPGDTNLNATTLFWFNPTNGLLIGSGFGLTNLDAIKIASGTVSPDRLGSGSSITTKFLRGDSTWQTITPGTGDLLAANNLSDVANATTSRMNLGTHDAANLTTGTVAPALLGSGSSITDKFLRGDSTWQSLTAANFLPVTGTTYLATNATSGGWLILTSEPDGTWSLQWSAANGFAAGKIYADPTTGTLHVSSDPFTVDQNLSLPTLPDDAGQGNLHGVTWSSSTKQLYRTTNPGRVTADQLIVPTKIAAASSQTNFTLSFTNSEQVLFSGNTNVNVSFADLVVGGSLTWRVDAITSSVNATVTLPATVVTNSGLVLTVTNGTARVFHAGLPYGALVTSNLWITGGDAYRR